MKNLLYILPVMMWLFITAGIKAQPIFATPDEAYGLDPLLYNGRFYTYFVPSSTKGTPFFNGPEFVHGSATIRGITYRDLLLKYDLLNQQLILQYANRDGGVLHIVLSDAWLESFNLGDAHFELLAMEDAGKQIYQVIGSGTVRVIYFWTKELELDTRVGARAYAFSKAKKKSYLLKGNILSKYTNNKSFIAQFDIRKQPGLKKYMHQQHINVKKATDQDLNELVNYCNALSPE